MKQSENRRLFSLLTFALIILLSIGFVEFSKIKSDLLIGQASAEIAKCGCSKCHTISLHGCEGCHNSPNDNNKPSNSKPGPQDASESDISSKEPD